MLVVMLMAVILFKYSVQTLECTAEVEASLFAGFYMFSVSKKNQIIEKG